MDTRPSLSPTDRDRSVRRIRTLTVATTIAGTAALGGFGLVAAISNPGHASTAATTAAVGTQTAAGADTASTNVASNAAPSPTPTVLQAAPQLPVGALGGGQTTSGGS